MPNSNTLIQIKRSDKTKIDLNAEKLDYGEPLFMELDEESDKHKYLAVGNAALENNQNNATVSTATYFEGILDEALLGKTVYANADNSGIMLQDGTLVATQRISPTTVAIPQNDDVKYYLVSYYNDATALSQPNIFVHSDTENNRGIFFTSRGVLNGGAWNDYAENRKCISGSPGQVVCENGHGELEVSSYKLQPLPYVISDTCGMVIGDRGDTYQPVALSGRVLVQTKEQDLHIGDVLCAGIGGFAEKMSRQEIINYPDRILGIVSEIPDYDVWNDIEINGRIWITIK